MRAFVGAIRYRIRLVNTETNEVRTLTRTTLRLELDELEPGTWYEATVFSIGRDSGNEEGSDVVRVQTGKFACFGSQFGMSLFSHLSHYQPISQFVWLL